MLYALFLILTISPFAHAPFAHADDEFYNSIQGEVTRLEFRLKSGQATAQERNRLAEIYFLTSRCSDVGKVLGGGRSLLGCACGGKCPKEGDQTKIEHFKRLLEHGHAWKDAHVQQLWQSVRDYPEARYWAVKALRSNRESHIQNMRFDLEKSLESLEVQPQ